MKDKELDDFFRKQSENPDIPYQETDWEKLRKKLDAPHPNHNTNGSKAGNKGLWIGLLALAIISGAGLGWKYWGNESRNPEATTNPLSSALAFDSSKAANPNEWQETNEIANLTAEDSVIVQITALIPDPMQPAIRLAKPEDPHGDKVASTLSTGFGFNVFANKSAIVKPLKRDPTTAIESNQHNIYSLSLGVLPEGLEQQVLASFRNHPRKQAPISKIKTSRNTIEDSRFYIAVTFAPDVSALKIKDIQGLGNTVGLNLEYFFHPKISINIGALYAFKTYQAGEGYSTGYVPAPNQVNGNCWVLDLPLNLRYYAFNQRLSRWYVTAGLSSYLMLKEKYDLEYKSYKYNGSAYGNSLEVQNKNKHYLNIVNVGIGYERVLTNKLSLQVEPYLKLPLKGIGEGDITLKSAGAFVGLKYGW